MSDGVKEAVRADNSNGAHAAVSLPFRISVVIPVYNCERYIADAVLSVRQQTYPVHEIIVVDDGSTDGTRAALAPHWDSIRYIQRPHEGVAAARNAGIALSSGEFIAFLDADDIWLPEKLQLQVEYFHSHPECALVYTDMKVFDESGILQESVKLWLNLNPPSGWIFPQLFHETLFAADGVMFRKYCLDRVGPFDKSLRCGEDYHMWLRFSRHFRVGYIDKPLVMYRQHPSMTTRSLAMADGVPWEARVIAKVVELYPEVAEELGARTVRKRLAKPYFYAGGDCLQRGDHRQARRFFAGALRHWPFDRRSVLFYLAACLTPRQLAGIKRLYRRTRLLRSSEQGKRAASVARDSALD